MRDNSVLVLHSVSKELGKGRLRTLVLDQISCVFPSRTHCIILGQRGSGKSTLLKILEGASFPTRGWVERKGSVCPGQSMMQRAASGQLTVRQVAFRLGGLYHMPPSQLIDFIMTVADAEEIIDLPIRTLPRQFRQRLALAFVYAIPFDWYLFDGVIGGGKGDFSERFEQAFVERTRDAGVVFVTSKPQFAQRFDGVGGVLHSGQLTLFKTVEEAIAAFKQIPPPSRIQTYRELGDEADDEGEEELV
jgi:capsular polysaccharide transport system ATP-binding protein